MICFQFYPMNIESDYKFLCQDGLMGYVKATRGLGCRDCEMEFRILKGASRAKK